MTKKNIPKIINGGGHTDARGTLNYFNNFNLSRVKRFYTIYHPVTTIVRAWQGHQYEQKWFYVVLGSFKIVLVKPDNWMTPSINLDCFEYNLTVEYNQVLHVPAGYATGFKAVETASKMLVFSNFSTEESMNDDFRFKKDKWYNWDK